MKCRLFLILLVLAALPLPASAGIIFGKKKEKPPPQERVPELIAIVRKDGDETKRADAVEELRQYDPAMFPDIVPTLVEALLHDPKPGVRSEAASSLGKIRPVSQAAGMALEQALAKDSSIRVRLSARSALLSYHWAGYRGGSGKKEEPPPINTKEPPLAPPLDPPPAKPSGPALTPVPQPAATPGRPEPLPPVSTQPLRPLPPGPPEPKGPQLNPPE